MFFGSKIFSLRYTVPISGLWMWFVVFVLRVWIIIEKRDFSFFPFRCKAPDRHQTCLFFNRNISFLRPCCVPSVVQTLLYCYYPPPKSESDGAVPPGMASPTWTIPSLRTVKEGGAWTPSSARAETRALCVVRQSSSVTSVFNLGQNISMVGSARFFGFYFLQDTERHAALLLHVSLSLPHAHTQTHTLISCPSNHHPAVLPSGRSQGGVSQSVLNLNTVFYYFSSNCL